MLREVFLSGQTTMTKSYLRFLVERIDVAPCGDRRVELNIVAKSGAAIQLLASLGVPSLEEDAGLGIQATNEKPGCFSTPEEVVKRPVLGSVGTWLRN